jgi:hypothetical protein
MAIRSTPGRRVVRPATSAIARSRALFGESLPELLLVTAVVAGVVSGAVALAAG